MFNEDINEYMQLKLQEIYEHYPELEIKKINHDKDHLHILISIPPKMSVGEVVRITKVNTARELKTKFDYIKKAYYGIGGIWSDGYFVSTVGVNENVIKKYVEHQGQEDSGQTLFDLS